MNPSDRVVSEKAILVGLNADCFKPEETATDASLDELEALLETAGGICEAKVLQNRHTPDPHSFIGEGKAEEIRQLAENTGATLVVFDNDLSPAQIRSLEELTQATVLDRSALILDIFAQRAKTAEGRLQVELAQYQYLLPRLSGMGKSMSRLGGGIGTRGPGESKLETDRRHIRDRITRLRAELAEVRKVRGVQRERRLKNAIPVVALVGYTNAGKSTLLNQLTDAGIPANDRLFDTLDTTTRRLRVSDHLEILLSDTVGFIRKLPPELVAAFRATLEEAANADLLLLVLDSAGKEPTETFEIVLETLRELKADHLPRIIVLNKIDKSGEAADFIAVELRARGERVVCTCARDGRGFDELLGEIKKSFAGEVALNGIKDIL